MHANSLHTSRVKELTPDLLYFAVFDGHGGSACADFCAEHMETHIMYWLRRGQTDLQALLQSSFIDINNAFAKFVAFNWPGRTCFHTLREAHYIFLGSSMLGTVNIERA